MALTTQHQQLDWTQITPLLIKANEVRITNQKINEIGELTTDPKKWVLDRVDWQFQPNHLPLSAMYIKNEDGVEEYFDFLSDVFKFYYDGLNKSIYGEVQAMDGGFLVTYRYLINFYGAQEVNNSDFLVSSGACYTAGINTVTAL